MPDTPCVPRFDLTGKTALVTGGGKGIGRWIALGFAESGADVAVAARTEAEVEAVAAEIRARGRRALAVTMDVRSVASIRESVARVLVALEGIDVLVNSAGTSIRRPVLDATEDEYELILDTNLKGTYFCSQVVGRAMVARGGGSIINIGSTAALVVRRRVPNSIYAASKAGVAMLTRACAEEWAAANVRVNCLALGRFETALAAQLAPPGSAEHARVLESVPLGRLGVCQDVVGPAVFFASEASAFITGQSLYVDGGRVLV
jgi:NAD(P)-dependent dehydrogenase (short-subunit alcohol dehydrogenase family)